MKEEMCSTNLRSTAALPFRTDESKDRILELSANTWPLSILSPQFSVWCCTFFCWFDFCFLSLYSLFVVRISFFHIFFLYLELSHIGTLYSHIDCQFSLGNSYPVRWTGLNLTQQMIQAQNSTASDAETHKWSNASTAFTTVESSDQLHKGWYKFTP